MILPGHWALAEMLVPYFLVVIKQSEVPQAALKAAVFKALLTLSIVCLSHNLYCICLIGVILGHWIIQHYQGLLNFGV